jgi:hypothetical protein
MAFLKNKARAIGLILLGLCVIYLTISETSHPLPFEMGPRVLKGFKIVFFLLFLLTLGLDIRKCLITKNFGNSFSTLLGVVCILGYFLTLHALEQRDKSPVVLKGRIPNGYYDGHALGFGYFIDFRADKTYKLEITHLFSNDYFRGTYHRTDSILELDTSIIDTILVSNRFVIKKDSGRESIIYQIDGKGNTLENKGYFLIYK